jgi:Holliday junction resolvase
MSELPPDEPSIPGANAGGRNAVAQEPHGASETDQFEKVRENRVAPGTVGAQRGGRRSRAKGDRIEREIVSRHAAIGIKAERYPLSGGSRFRGSGHDVDIYVFGEDEGPLVAEVKSRRCGAGFITLEKWLGECDFLFLRRDSAEPMVLLPWRVWVALLARVRR